MIAGVLDEVILPEDLDSEDYPSLTPCSGGFKWFRKNLQCIEGYLRTAGYQILNLGEKLLFTPDLPVRTLYRYEKAFAEKQFAGLRSADREKHRSQKLPENIEFLLEQAIQLRREVPEWSVAQIIYILEAEGLVAPGILKRSTLERHIYRAGYGQKQMQMYKEARNSSSKRFCKPHRMMLIQGDIKYGSKLPIGKNGTKVQTYLSSAIDDHSRYLLSSRFYDNQEEAIIEDTFHQAISRYGTFDACYFDNGSQYIAKTDPVLTCQT